MLIGGLLTITSIAILVAAIKAKKNIWILLSVIGLLSILAALSSGSSFITKDSDTNSFVMAIGLGISWLVYSAGIYFSAVSKKDK